MGTGNMAKKKAQWDKKLNNTKKKKKQVSQTKKLRRPIKLLPKLCFVNIYHSLTSWFNFDIPDFP